MEQPIAAAKQSVETCQSEPREFPELLQAIRTGSDYTEEEMKLVTKAYLFAQKHYDGTVHKSGTLLLSHCCNITQKLWEIKSDAQILVTGFLHDILKHTNCSREDLKNEFGDEIVQLVSGVQMFYVPETHIDKYLEHLEKLFVEMSKDVRIAIIRLVHRLDDLEHLEWRKRPERKNILRETKEIFIPLSKRLGMRSLSSKLEDLTFRYTFPSAHTILAKKLEQTRKEDETYLELVIAEVRKLLWFHSIHATVTGRIKGIYSLYRKMIVQRKPMDKLLDKIAIRIIVDDIPACYQVLGILHVNFTHIPGTFDDYVSIPKANKYQSLHTCVYPIRNLAEKPIEIQIRTPVMHQVAEYGIAAHWKYKENVTVAIESKEQLTWIQSLVDLKKSHKSSRSYYSALKRNISLKYIIVFDEQGKVIYLPNGAMPKDFAHHTGRSFEPQRDKIKINGKPAKHGARLQNGDTIEILSP